ncbi:zinc finger SWIM domain-containing protein 7 isoform X2 [Eumetopias jubatus]|uniref:zinc finger SWIM domain-containing protein 7 isoform X2 n=1 Tax=Eumetopias jubatus TaxID=34886 RepID=UPI0010162DFC|nr:zinc finger SWIM domain-containing protein 7 isoform X2 [Eumetopias jubatus]
MASALPGVTLPAVVEELLSEMAAAVQENARIPDEHLSALKFIFGSSAIQALDLVDRQSITLISSPSGRRVYQVSLLMLLLSSRYWEVLVKHTHAWLLVITVPVLPLPSRCCGRVTASCASISWRFILVR